MEDNDSIEYIKANIALKEGIPVEQQRLILGGQQLQEDGHGGSNTAPRQSDRANVSDTAIHPSRRNVTRRT